MAIVRKFVFGLIWLVVFLLALVGVADNSTEVPLVYLGYSTPSIPVAWWILLAFMTGVLIGYLTSFGSIISSNLKVRSLKRQLVHRENQQAGSNAQVKNATHP